MIPDVTLEDRKETKKGPDKGAANKEGLDKEILNKETLSNETPNKEAASAYVPRPMRPVAEQPSTVNSESPQNPTEAEAAAMPAAAPALHAAEKQPEAIIQAEIKILRRKCRRHRFSRSRRKNHHCQASQPLSNQKTRKKPKSLSIRKTRKSRSLCSIGSSRKLPGTVRPHQAGGSAAI